MSWSWFGAASAALEYRGLHPVPLARHAFKRQPPVETEVETGGYDLKPSFADIYDEGRSTTQAEST